MGICRRRRPLPRGGRPHRRVARSTSPGSAPRSTPNRSTWRQNPCTRERGARPYEIDPWSVPQEDKLALLQDWSRRLLAAPGIDHVDTVPVRRQGEQVLRGPGGNGDHPATGAPVPGVRCGRHQRRHRRLRDHGHHRPAGRPGLGVPDRARIRLGHRAGAASRSGSSRSCSAPSIEPGRYDLVIDPSNLWLTIHESIGHATELDRALGYEANYAGMSFATPDKLGTLAVRLTDHARHRRPHGRARPVQHRLGRRRRPGPVLRHRQGRRARRVPARPPHRLARRLRTIQRLRLRRLPRPRAHPTDGQRQPAARAPTGRRPSR